MADILTEAWLLFLLALITSCVLFPITFVMSFAYGALAKKYAGIPRVAWMFACIFVATFAVLLIIEAALGSPIFQTAGALAAP
jgi:hypothetical protein